MNISNVLLLVLNSSKVVRNKIKQIIEFFINSYTLPICINNKAYISNYLFIN